MLWENVKNQIELISLCADVTWHEQLCAIQKCTEAE